MASEKITTTKTKSKKRQVVFEGTEEFDPFGGIKKLMGGFCDPSGAADDSTMNTAPSLPELKSQVPVQVERDYKRAINNKPTYGLDNGTTKQEVETAVSRSIAVNGNKKTDGEEEKEANAAKTAKTRELPELKATHSGAKLRVRRGIEVTIFALVFVVGTLFALQKLGYELDFSVIDSNIMTEPKRLINIVSDRHPAKRGGTPQPRTSVNTDSNDRAKVLLDELNSFVNELKEGK